MTSELILLLSTNTQVCVAAVLHQFLPPTNQKHKSAEAQTSSANQFEFGHLELYLKEALKESAEEVEQDTSCSGFEGRTKEMLKQ